MEKFKSFVLEWIINMIQNFDVTVETSKNLLTMDITSNKLFDFAETIQNIIYPTALVIMVLMFMLSLLSLVNILDSLSFEHVMSKMLLLVFSKVLLENTSLILLAIYFKVASWVDSVSIASGTLSDSVGSSIETLIANMGWMEVFGLLCTMGLSFLFIWLSGIVIIAIAYGRQWELYSYISVGPLAFSLVQLDNGRITKGYILKFAGLCLQALFIIMGFKFYNIICVDTLIPAAQNSSDLSEITYNMLLGSIVLMMAVIKSGSLAKEILGG